MVNRCGYCLLHSASHFPTSSHRADMVNRCGYCSWHSSSRFPPPLRADMVNRCGYCSWYSSLRVESATRNASESLLEASLSASKDVCVCIAFLASLIELRGQLHPRGILPHCPSARHPPSAGRIVMGSPLVRESMSVEVRGRGVGVRVIVDLDQPEAEPAVTEAGDSSTSTWEFIQPASGDEGPAAPPTAPGGDRPGGAPPSTACSTGRAVLSRPSWDARLERAAAAGAAARDKLTGRLACVPPTPELHGMPKNRIYVVLRSSVGDVRGGAGGRTRGVPPAPSSRASTDTGWRRTQSSTASPPRKKDYGTGPPLGATGSRGGSCGLDKSLSVPAPCGPCQCSAAGAPAPRCPRGAGCQPEDDAGCQPEDAVRSGVGRTLSMSVGVVLVHHLRELV